MTAKYASQTSVSVEKSQAEIQRILQRYDAKQYMQGWDQERAVVAFVLNDKQVRFVIPLPDKNDDEFWYTEAAGKKRTEAAAHKQWEQSCRQKWRALCLIIKAKLEAVESGISVFEEEFMAHIVLPDGSTVGEYMLPQIEASYETGTMPPMLPFLNDG